MKFVIIATALLVVAVAKPGTYKENEEFKYARSSTDEGSKSGFYEAQRGNVGGNYERAHNMDNPAQKTLSQAIQQTEGVIGDSSRLTHGDVFNSGSSRGVYSQGQYDLSNLQGRNFEESGYQGESASHSALNSGYNRQSSHLGYGGKSEAYTHRLRGNDYKLYDDVRQAPEHLNSGYYESGKESAHHSEYRSENSYRGNHLDNSGASYVKSGAPVKIILRPGTTEYVPITAQTYQDRVGSSHYQAHSANQEALSAINTDVNYIKPAQPKHYESSYDYNKQWEKHDSRPAPAPLAIVPVPPRSELYDDNTVSSGGSSFRANDINQHSEFNKYRAATKSESRHESEYNRHVGAVNSDVARDFDTSGLAALTANVPSSIPAPKKYESSFAYHKSWERQGDPYEIRPAEAAESQRLTDANQGYGSYSRQYGSQHKHSHSSYTQGEAVDCDCDEGQLRVSRSVDSQRERVDPYKYSQVYEGQQVQSENLEDFGQETQSAWDLRDFSQQSGKLEDIGQQQTEDLTSFSKHHKWDNENLSQQQQKSNWDQLRSFDQQSQGNVNNFQQPKPHTYNLHRDLELPHDTPKLSSDSNDNNKNHPIVGTESTLLSVDDTQQTQDENHGRSLTSFTDSTSQNHFRPSPGSNPFPTHYWHDVTQNRDQSNTMHGYNQNAFASDSQLDTGLQNHKPLKNVWDQVHNSQHKYTAHSYGYEYGQNSNFMVNSNNENNFRSQWQPIEDHKILESDFEKHITTTPESHKIVSGLGRGDIESDDVTGQDINPKTSSSNRNIFDHTNTTPKPLRTPEEIEALSQTKPHHNEDNGQNPEVLGVLSIPKQDYPFVTTTSSSKFRNSNLDRHETQSSDWQQNIEQQSSGLQQNIEQQSADFGQEIQTGVTWEENLRDFNPNQSADHHRDAKPQSYNLHRHQTEEVNHKSDNADNLSQQQQTGWVDGIQETQQLQSDLKDFNPNEHKANTARVNPSSNNNGDIQMQVTNSEQNVRKGEKNAEILDLTQSTTEGPGFWKSVGNKFVSAKDKVSSWFKSKE